MKSSLKVFALLLALNTGAWMIPQDASAQQGSRSFQLFYDELSPYGIWVEYPHYGYVWIPDVDPGFSPYATAGYWVYTDDGWTWVSDYPWGWATFHYGRWDYDNVYGWFWVPDNEWGPAWVTWRRSPGYYGWAPLRPGISVSMAMGRDYHEQNERWIFVRDRDIDGPDIGRHYVNRTENVTIINNSTVIVNTREDSKRNATYIAGPDRNDVQNVTHTTVKSVAIRESDKPVQHLSNGQLEIYRPQVQKGSGNGQNPAPSKVMKLSDVRPASERKAGNLQQQPPAVTQPNKGQPLQPRDVPPSAGKGREQLPPAVNLPIKSQTPQPREVPPSESKAKEQQPHAVNRPNMVQPAQRRVTVPSESKGREQPPPAVNAPNKGQPPHPQEVNPSGGKGRKQKPPTVNAPNKGQPPQPQEVNPSGGKGREQKPSSVNPPNKGQPPQPREVNPSDSKGKEKQPQNDTPSNKDR